MEPIRMYLNKVYDCDTCDGKDNDGGNTIPSELDPATDTKCYAGRGSILWNDLRRCDNQEMVIDASGNTLTLPGVVASMRNLPEIEGIGAGPFSPQGHYYFSVTKRMKTWPKVVSSYDGERKYINYKNSNDIYYYALQGLGLTSLPAFIEQRWRIRDGYYQTGDFKDASHVLGGRIGAKPGAVIRFRAAKDGYFGIGNDGGNVTQGMFLKAGEEGVFDNFQHGDNVLLYIYQADRMSEIDLSEISIDPNFQFSVMKLAQKIVIGSENHANWILSTGNTGFLQTMNLGELPFLKHLDVRNTEIRTINSSKCPRLVEILAGGSELTSLVVAETAPLVKLDLPSSITELNLVNLPYLSYPGGLTLAGVQNIKRLMLGGCPNIDPQVLINDINGASGLRYLRLPGLNITAPSSLLTSLKSSGAVGLDPNGQAYEEDNQCSGVTGRWIFSDMVDDSQLDKNNPNSLASYFPELEMHQSQFSCISYADYEDDSENISNEDEGTGYLYNNDYTIPAHWRKYEALSKAYRCLYDNGTKKMLCRQISDTNYEKMADGSGYDASDLSGEGFDIMKHLPKAYFKGVNDFKNQKKYTFLSTLDNEPMSTCAVNEDGTIRRNRKKLKDCLVAPLAAVYMANCEVGGEYATVVSPNMNVHAIDVDGMRQVRWPGMNNGSVGAVFLDENNKIISKYAMAVSHTYFDFVIGDYIFIDVPKGAKRFVFTAPKDFDEEEAIAVDSTSIEAIEPDWVTHDPELLGVYGGSMDALMRIRSLSGAWNRRGDNNHTTNGEWAYDANGNLTNLGVPTSTMHYSSVDLINLCRMRGEGYQAQDYESHSFLAQIIYGIVGNRNIQAVCGYGCSENYQTGVNGANGFGNVTRIGSSTGYLGNIIFGIQNYIACCYEAMDNVGINVANYLSWRKGKYSDNAAADPIDAKWHIYNPATKTERVVQGLNSDGYCIGRTKHGRYCDIIASRVTADRSQWNKNYCDVHYYQHQKGRLPRRAGGNANASFGLAFVDAFNAGSGASPSYGVRLAFRGAIEIVKS